MYQKHFNLDERSTKTKCIRSLTTREVSQTMFEKYGAP